MKTKTTIALLALTSAILTFALSSCATGPSEMSGNPCLWAKHVKDSVINAQNQQNIATTHTSL